MAVSACSKSTSLALRILTCLLLILSLLIIVTNTKTIKGDYTTVKIRFSDFYGYRYMAAVAVIGLALSLLQIALSIYSLVSKSDGTVLFDYFTDKLLSYLILSGSVAGLAVSVDAKANLEDNGGVLDTYFGKAFASASLLLLAFFCTAVVSILSSFALTKRGV